MNLKTDIEILSKLLFDMERRIEITAEKELRQFQQTTGLLPEINIRIDKFIIRTLGEIDMPVLNGVQVNATIEVPKIQR